MEKHFAIAKSIFRRIAQKPRKNPGKNYAKCTTIYSLFIICSQKFNNFSSIFYHLYHCTKVYKMCNSSLKLLYKKAKRIFFVCFLCILTKNIAQKSCMFFVHIAQNPSFVNVTEKAFYIMILLCILLCVATATF